MAAQSTLRIEDLRFRYKRGTAELFSGLSHDFPAGQITALIGDSGAGKSTLLYVLGLLLRPREGCVYIGETAATDLGDGAQSRLRGKTFGFVFQDAALDPTRDLITNVVEPHLYNGRNRRSMEPRARALLAAFGLEEACGRRPGEVSGGQGQRAAIARALLMDPPILLADEPTGNLDAGNTAYVLSTLRREADNGRTVVVATHDVAVVRYADTVVHL